MMGGDIIDEPQTENRLIPFISNTVLYIIIGAVVLISAVVVIVVIIAKKRKKALDNGADDQ